MAWRLDQGTDLVLELHMAPSGKPELIQPLVGLYFAEKPPTKIPVQLRIEPPVIDIPAGEENYVIEDSFVLPVDVDVLSIFPYFSGAVFIKEDEDAGTGRICGGSDRRNHAC